MTSFFYLEQFGRAEMLPNYRRQRFVREGTTVRRVEEDAVVLRLNDQQPYVCADYADSLVYDRSGQITPKLGLNLEPVAELLRKHAFPENPSGAAYLRWPTGWHTPSPEFHFPFGVIVVLRQTLQMDRRGGWLELADNLHTFLVNRTPPWRS